MTKNSTRAQVNRMDGHHVRRLQDWVQQNRQDLESTPRTKVDAAALCSAALGFPVTVSNLVHACEVMKVTLATSRPVAPAPPAAGDLTALTHAVMDIGRRLAAIERSLGSAPRAPDALFNGVATGGGT